MGKAYFITATGTDSGKTFVAEGLARALRGRGHAVRALKPVLSGYDESALPASDAGRLLAACGRALTAEAVADIAPWRFAAPLSPDRAAALEGRDIDFSALVNWCRAAMAGDDGLLLIEGIGGAMVPLDMHHTVRDWIAALDLPTLVVTGTYLGAVSHALTTLAALREAGIMPAMLIVNESASSSVSMDDTMASLRSHIGDIPMHAVGRDAAAALAGLADRLVA
jgi:dethiobiotin synthetase